MGAITIVDLVSTALTACAAVIGAGFGVAWWVVWILIAGGKVLPLRFTVNVVRHQVVDGSIGQRPVAGSARV